MTVYVDSNYWVYWMDRRQPEHRFVTKPMRAAIREGVLLSLATLIEVAHYFRGLGEPEFSHRMDKLRSLGTLTSVELDTRVTGEALRILGRYGGVGVGGRDAVILATMRLHGVTRILTHDRDFSRVKGIRVMDTIPERL